MRGASRRESPPPPTHEHMLNLKYPVKNTTLNRGATAALSKRRPFSMKKIPNKEKIAVYLKEARQQQSFDQSLPSD